MVLALTVNFIFYGFFTALLIALSVDEAKHQKRAREDFETEQVEKAA
jgi:hypothetical protein